MLGKHSLKPGERTDLKVSYDTADRPGPFEKKVILTTNLSDKEQIEILTIKGMVNEAPSAIIAATPRRITLTGSERRDGKEQAITIKNEGVLPLVINGIRSRDGSNVYFDGTGQGAITIEHGQTKNVEIRLGGNDGNASEREYIVIDCNARNARDTGYFIIIQYEM